MPSLAMSTVLKREHHEIDCGIYTFIEELDRGDVAPEPLTAALDALRRHIYIEEVFLFPPIRQTGMVMPVFVMMREHGQLWRTMGTLTDLLADGNDSQQLRDACDQLLDQLHQHNSKEEPVIYPHADGSLPLQASAELTRFVQTGRTPDEMGLRAGGYVRQTTQTADSS